MKDFSVALQAHLDTGTTTMCFCWRVTRQDSVVQGFTEHDKDLTFDGTTFEAASGFTATAVESSLGLSVDNLDVEGALSSDTINEDDLAAGVYDNADVELWWVNWADVSMRTLVTEGKLGEVKRMQTAFNAELRSKADRLAQKTGRTYQRYCDADLGDARCKIDLEDSAYKGTGSISSVTDARNVVVSGIGSYSNDWFTLGKLMFTSGDNDGLTYEIKAHDSSSGSVKLELWLRPTFAIAPGDSFIIRAGCKKDHATCRDKFSNILNFQGFPFVPGNDVLMAYPIQGGANQNGGSIFADSGGNG